MYKNIAYKLHKKRSGSFRFFQTVDKLGVGCYIQHHFSFKTSFLFILSTKSGCIQLRFSRIFNAFSNSCMCIARLSFHPKAFPHTAYNEIHAVLFAVPVRLLYIFFHPVICLFPIVPNVLPPCNFHTTRPFHDLCFQKVGKTLHPAQCQCASLYISVCYHMHKVKLLLHNNHSIHHEFVFSEKVSSLVLRFGIQMVNLPVELMEGDCQSFISCTAIHIICGFSL